MAIFSMYRIDVRNFIAPWRLRCTNRLNKLIIERFMILNISSFDTYYQTDYYIHKRLFRRLWKRTKGNVYRRRKMRECQQIENYKWKMKKYIRRKCQYSRVKNTSEHVAQKIKNWWNTPGVFSWIRCRSSRISSPSRTLHM